MKNHSVGSRGVLACATAVAALLALGAGSALAVTTATVDGSGKVIVTGDSTSQPNAWSLKIVSPGVIQVTDQNGYKVQPLGGCKFYFWGVLNSVRCTGTAGVQLNGGGGKDHLGPYQDGLPALDIRGGNGDDSLSGSPNTDFIFGENGQDRLNTEAVGTTSNSGDWLFGGADFDRVYGTDKTDVAFGGAGFPPIGDVIKTYAGDDFVFADDDEADGDIQCGDGADTAYVDAIDQFVSADCETQFVDGQ